MPELRVQVPHELPPTTVISALESLVSGLEASNPVDFRKCTWETETNRVQFNYQVYGFQVRWNALVLPKSIDLHCEFPVGARPFEHKIESAILSRIDDALEPTVEVRRAA